MMRQFQSGVCVFAAILAFCAGMVSEASEPGVAGVSADAGQPARTASKVRGNVYVVSPDGSDKARGDATHPWQTISRALLAARAGDTIRLRPGVYSERVVVNVSGAEGQPLVIEGERGPKGEWLSVIDPAMPLKARWVAAPEVGAGVYKMSYPGFEPFLMLVDGKFIPRIWPDHMADGEGFAKLSYDPDQKVETYGGKKVCFWDVMGAMYGCKQGTVYLRFRDRDDPNARQLRIGPKGGGVEIIDQNWIVLRNLQIGGAQNCVAVSGPKATHNRIENCRLVNASERVSLSGGASHTVICDNEVTAEFYSEKCLTGAWGGAQTGEAIAYELGLKYLFYWQYKMFFGPNATSDYGIRIEGGSGNEVCRNHVTRGGQGIHLTRTADARVHDNIVEGLSSIGIIVTMDRVVNVQIYDNLIADSNIGCRIHHTNELRQTEPRSVYVYRNRFWQPVDVGTGIFFHYHENNDTEPYRHAQVFIYHNSFAGGRSGMQISAYADKCGGLPETLVMNNVFSTRQPVDATSRFMKMRSAWRTFDYNWLGGTGKPDAPWCAPHNIDARGQTLWDPSQQPDFVLPARSTCRSAGLDLSRPLTLDGATRPPLAGMDHGYFAGERPDLGAVQRRAASR